jgi:hypothetical protein
MAGPLRDLKTALKELSCQLNIKPLHEVEPNTWRELNEVLKTHRDYFVHPNPELFTDRVNSSFNLNWEFPSSVAARVLEYYFRSTMKEIPPWVANTGLRSRGFDIV